MCFIIVSLFISTLFLHVFGRDPALRIVGGTDVGENELPYVARMLLRISQYNSTGIFEQELHICTCAILKPTWTLTAAHCFVVLGLNITGNFTNEEGYLVKYKYQIRYRPFQIKSNRDSERDMTSNIVEWIQHPASNFRLRIRPILVSNDIGLMKTEEIRLPQYGRISAMDYRSLVGLEVTATGYGLTNAGGVFGDAPSLGKPLQKLGVIVIQCSPRHTYVRPGVCIARRCGKFSVICPGDSGGPLVHSSGIIGVNSAGPIVCQLESFGNRFLLDMFIQIPTSPYIDWISDVINKDT